jgi:hypothetical protein
MSRMAKAAVLEAEVAKWIRASEAIDGEQDKACGRERGNAGLLGWNC